MATQKEILERLDIAATNAENATDAYNEVLTTEGEQDIPLVDGTTTPNLNKRLRDIIGAVKSVQGKTGDIVLLPKDIMSVGSNNLNATPAEDPVPEIIDENGTRDPAANAQAQALLNRIGYLSNSKIQSIKSWSDLELLAGKEDGQEVLLTSYHSGLYIGGGTFRYNSARKSENDGGTICNGWERKGEFGELNIGWFGAKFDGTDETAIFQKAINVADNETTIFVDGDILISSVNYGTKPVSIRGVPSISAQTLKTTLKISGAGIICSTQKAKIAYIDFQSTGNKTDGQNRCLFTNNKNNGVWLHVTNCRASGFSGHTLYAKDLIDSKISGFVPNNNNVVFRFYKDAWVASTTIQLEKVYAQNNTLLFDADDCDHCSMIDCIFEFNTSLGHSHNSSWSAFNLYTENNGAPLLMNNSYWVPIHHYAYTANDRVIVDQSGLNAIDKGQTTIEYNRIHTGSFDKDFERLTNITPSFSGQTWTKLGTAYLGEAGSMCIEIVGASSYTQPSTPSNIQAVGKTVILAQAKNAGQAAAPNIHATWHNIGVSVGVSDVRFVQTGTNRYVFDVFILQDSSAYIGFKVDVNKGDYFVRDVQRSQPKPTGGGSGDVNTATMLIAFNYARIGSSSAYVGSDGVNPIIGAPNTTSATAGTATALPAQPVGYISVNINGTVRKIPYYA